MIERHATNYFGQLSRAIDGGWRRFWFLPIDPLPTCIMRWIAGVMSLYFIGSFSFDLLAWFGAEGLLPRAAIARLTTNFGQNVVYRFSFFQLADDPAYLWAVHGLALFVTFCFTIGLFTRWFAPATLIALLSYIHRAPMVTGQFEPVLTMLVAYLCLAPCGAYLSVDAWRRRSNTPEPRPSVAANISLRLMQLHLAGLYIMTGLTMLGGETWWMGDAVWWLMAHTESRLIDITALGSTDMGRYFINLTAHGLVAFQLLYALLIWRPLARPILIALSLVVWTFIALLTGLVGYCLLMFLANAAFLSTNVLRNCFRGGHLSPI